VDHTELKTDGTFTGLHQPGAGDPIGNGCTQCHGPNLNDGFAPSCFTCHGARWLGETAPPDHTELKGGSVKHKPGAESPFVNGCTQCHGPNLNDGPAPSCFACHGANWVDHDFSARSWLQPGQSSCYPCHDGPDWKHALSPTIGYTVSTTTLSVQADPTGASAKCMGCHEGNLAVDDYLNGPATPAEFITGAAALGTNLARHHPVSFVFDTALATTHGALNDPATTWSHLPSGGSIRQDLLDAAGDLQCTSCHNQHDNTNGDYLVNPTQTLCFTCHTFSPPPGAHHIPGRDDPWGIASGSDFNCTMCHGANLAGTADAASAPACTSCHNPFVFPDLPGPGHHGGDRFDPYRQCAACHGAYLQGAAYGKVYAPSCTECHGNLWSGANQPPIVDPGSGGVYTGTAGQTVAFDASGTTDPDADPLAYVWYFGDGSPIVFPALGVATASHVFSATGTYQGYLSVSDGVNEPVVAPFTVEIVADPGSEAPDIWDVTTTTAPPEVFTLTIEDHGGVFVGIKDDGTHPTSLAIGIEFVGVVFWMDLWMDLSGNVLWGTGNTYFGNINRNAGTMVGIVFDAGGGLATFTGTALP
jgi:predicted CXXCH cytochrome family protein